MPDLPRTASHDRQGALLCGPCEQGAPRHVGLRIAAHRGALALTQAELAERVAISRVALSNLESGRSEPGERTVTLLAGVFGLEPHELVEGTSYPAAKADRLPLVAARYTEVEMRVALLERDLCWLESAPTAVAESILGQWYEELLALSDVTADASQRGLLRSAIERCVSNRHRGVTAPKA